MEAIRLAGVRLGADPLGGTSLPYWARIAEEFGLSLEVVNLAVDPTFSFMPLDHVYSGANWRLVNFRRGPRTGADHYPLEAEFVWTGAN